MTISFEEFSEWSTPHIDLEPAPRYNNFFLYFVKTGGDWDKLYRGKKYFVRFNEENPEKEKFLTDAMTFWKMKQPGEFRNALPLYEPELYEAYKIMSEYIEPGCNLFA